MLDEDGSKVRRNLLVVSAIVTAIAWLQVPMDAVITKAIGLRGDCGSGATHVDPRRVWSAILVLMFYLVWRYAFSKSSKDAWGEMVLEWRHGLKDRVRRHLEADCARVRRRGWDHSKVLCQQIGPQHPHRNVPAVRIDPSKAVFKEFRSYGHPGGEGIAEIVEGPLRPGLMGEPALYRYRMSWWSRAIAGARATAEVLLASISTTELIVPVIAATAAMSWTAIRLCEAFFAST